MDGGSFRGSRPNERVVNRSESPRRQPAEEPRPTAKDEPVAPAQSYRSSSSPSEPPVEKKSSKRRFTVFLGIAIVIGLGIIAATLLLSPAKNTSLGIDSSKYQAVFFTNGQVYFGKLQGFNEEYLRLTDIYYLQTQAENTSDSDTLQQTGTDLNNVQLIKLGDEIHGPEDEMIISKDQVLFYENLKTDGKVSESIQQYKNNN